MVPFEKDRVMVINRKPRKGRPIGMPNEQPAKAGIPVDPPLEVEPEEDPTPRKPPEKICVCHHREQDHARNGGQCYLHRCDCFRFNPEEVV